MKRKRKREREEKYIVKSLFVKVQTEHEEGWVCFSLVSVDGGWGRELLS